MEGSVDAKKEENRKALEKGGLQFIVRTYLAAVKELLIQNFKASR